MSRIDAPIATQVGDASRPNQTTQMLQDQVKHARVHDLRQSEQVSAPLPLSEEDVRAGAQRVKQVLEAASGKKFAFGLKVDEDTKDIIAEFTDNEGKVIKEVPSEEIRQLTKRLSEFIGVFLDKTA